MEFIHRRYKNIPLLIKVKFLNTNFMKILQQVSRL